MQRLKQMEHKGFQNYLRLHRIGSLKKIVRINTTKTQDLAGIHMIQDLRYLFSQTVEKFNDTIYFMLHCL